MASALRENFMAPRRDWNAMGPKLPAWFRLRLRRTDPSLVLQFIPPDTQAQRGVSSVMYPHGVWAICRKMKRSKLLHKRWVYAMAQRGDGMPLNPSLDTIHLLRIARDLSRNGQGGQLAEQYDRSCRAMMQEKREASRQRMYQDFDRILRRDNYRAHPNRIRVPRKVA